MPTRLAPLILILFFLTIPAIPAMAEPTGHGYITRLMAKPQYSSDSDVIVKIIGYYTEGGRYVPKPVPVSITIKIAGTDTIVKTRNATLNDNQIHPVNLGRLHQNTYTIIAQFPDGEKTDNFAVLHPPIPYAISMDNKKIIFRSLGGKNDTFSITIKALYSPENEQTYSRANITNLTYHISGTPQIVTVWITDRWGNTNAQNDGKAYVITYAKPVEFYFWRPIVAIVIVLLGLFAIVYMKRHEVVA